MKVAVLGVGLIGGSIGLAARGRLGAEVRAWDPDQALLGRALERGAVDSPAGSVTEAVQGAELVFCAGPVSSLPALCAEALSAAGSECAVTDVGSVKRGVIEALGSEPRFVGGHPLAGAESSGVENARADLFEGARWYLTPTARTGGMHYDRVQRAVADLGARPQALEAEAHDRLMATVSHLPHVLANVLVAQAAEALRPDSDRLPEVGPSFRDATRVAGANPAIWPGIFSSNREAIAAEVEAAARRLSQVAELLRSAGEEEVGAWHGRAAERRRELIEGELAGGPLSEVRILVPNRPGIVAEIALALGREAVNIEDMALHPAADMRSGAISIFVAGEQEAERAAGLLRELGHDVARLQR